ncbi:MAG: hypothetical protein AAGI49_16570 [Bacteroidota bacterium]
MNKKITTFWVLSCLLLTIACQQDTADEVEPSFIVADQLFNCPFDLTDIPFSFQVNQVYEYEGFSFYGGFNDLLVTEVGSSGALVAEKYGVNEFMEYDNTLVICADEGIFSVDRDLNIRQRTDVNCQEIVVTKEQELIFLTLGSRDMPSSRIYQLSADQVVSVYANFGGNGGCSALDALSVADNGDVWAADCGGKLIRFRNGEWLDFFDENNSPFNRNNGATDVFLLPFEDSMIVLFKNGVQYQLLKYADEEWIVLYELSATNAPESEQDIAISLPSLVDAAVWEGQLYIATTLASCRGIQIFDVTKNDRLVPEDYYIARDPNFGSQCINAFEILADGTIYVVVQGEVGVFRCGQ